MDDRLNDLIAQLQKVSPPAGLDDRVIYAVGRDRRRARLAATFLYSAICLAAPALLASIRLLIADVSATPLAPLLGLAFTDWGTVRQSLWSWILAVLEALPVSSIALTLAGLFALAVLADRAIAMVRARNQQMKEAI